MARKSCVALHRYAGLAMALFLALAGLTGSVLAFRHELDAWLNPELFYVQTRGKQLTADDLAASVARSDPRIRVIFLPLRLEPGRAAALLVQPRIDPSENNPVVVDYNQIFVDPVTGQIVGRRYLGACCFDRHHVIQFLYIVHYSLFAGKLGKWLMGAVALVWVFDCFIGFYLTLPSRGNRPGFWRRWKAAWLVKTSGRAYHVNFGLHRASGLWFWCVLLVLAVSSVALNLNNEIFRPLVGLFSKLTPQPFEQFRPRIHRQTREPLLSFDDAIAKTHEHATQSSINGWLPASILHAPSYGTYAVTFEHPDAVAAFGSSTFYIDDQDGRLLTARLPNERTAGDSFVQLQLPLHSGQIGGLAGRIIVAVAGIVTTTLSVTGIVIWWKKRRGRLRAAAMRRRANDGRRQLA